MLLFVSIQCFLPSCDISGGAVYVVVGGCNSLCVFESKYSFVPSVAHIYGLTMQERACVCACACLCGCGNYS